MELTNVMDHHNKAVSILAGNLNSGRSYLITVVLKVRISKANFLDIAPREQNSFLMFFTLASKMRKLKER